jgi:spore germination cell wall hydrolase CwlJ-like protein
MLGLAFWLPQQAAALSSRDGALLMVRSPRIAAVDSILEQAIVATPLEPAPRAPIVTAAAAPPLAHRWRVSSGVDIDREFKCLALNVYWEARSEPLQGKMAVAHVTLNRAVHRLFPGSICGVVFQGEKRGQYLCQFSWVCDGLSDTPTNAAAWRQARNVAHTVLFQTPTDPTNGALWYHATYVWPNWADQRHQIVQIGQHVFYNRVRLKHEMTSDSRRS